MTSGSTSPARGVDTRAAADLDLAVDRSWAPAASDGVIGDLAQTAPVVHHDTPSTDVQDMFRRDPGLRWVVMLGGQKPVLVERAWFDAQMTGRLGFGRLIHSRSVLGSLPHPGSLVLPDATPVAAAAAAALRRANPATSFDGIVVVTPAGLPAVASVTAVFERLARRYAHQSLHDPLTGLPNRLFVMERLRGRAGTEAVLFYIDLDRFKDVNDSLGHGAGDQVLVQFAERLRASSREDDLVARLGGDEFVLLSGAHLSDLQSSALAERLVLAASSPYVVDVSSPGGSQGEQLVTIGASVGIARAGGRETEVRSLDVLLKHADIAMYRAKSRGRGRVEHYRAELLDGASGTGTALAQHSMERRLRSAITGGRLHLAYQPIVELPEGRLRGAEALARWDDDELGQVAPDVFVALAEQTGLIQDLGRWVLNEACAQAARWQSPSGRRPSVSVNVSPVQLAEMSFVDDVRRALTRSGLEPDRLCLEITETAAIADVGLSAALLDQLRTLGVQLALDDFGTGHSSLTLLRRLPTHLVKIDRSFVERVAEDAGDAVLVRLVVDAAHSLGMRVCAEGVERPEQANQLQALGCDVAQGWLFGRPVPAEDFARTWLDPDRPDAPVDVSVPPPLALTGHDELVLVVTTDHEVVYVSSSCRRMLGWVPREVVGRVLGELSTVGSGSVSSTVRLRHSDGTDRWLRGRLQPLRAEPGRRPELLGVFTDVTDVVEQERALAASEQLFRHAFDDAPIGIALSDLNGRLLRVNRSFADLLGREAAELTSLTVDQITHPDDRAVDAVNLAATDAATPTTQRVTKRYLHADGRPVPVEVHAATVPAAGGREAGIVAHVLPRTAPALDADSGGRTS